MASTPQTAATGLLSAAARSGLGTPLVLLLMMAMVVLPLPPWLLDVLFTFNISLAIVVLLACVYTRRPLEFAVFPTVLLLGTLLRLALNVASTRVVLLHGHTGTDAAGQVIRAFGEFVVGGSYAVGFVVFAVLVIINFVVVTKGAGRISEVFARFTLDAMPGKQMAIDADLSAGIIDQQEAKRRRAEIAQEADFYGAMDGASKFVRGDAIAGILIVFINILGGLAIGTLQHGMPLGQAFQQYALLTIGDGLVAQIPSLVLSTAAAIMVTRMSSEHDMPQQILAQLFANPRALAITAAVIGTIGLIPGMPNVAFLTLATVSGASAYLLAQRRREAAPQAAGDAAAAAAPLEPEQRELTWEDVPAVDPIGLEVGYRLIPLVDRGQGGQLLARIKGVRRKLSQELGFLVPPVHIRDNLSLAPTAYRIAVLGAAVAEASVHPDRELAINPGQVYGPLEGIETRDPAFGLPAVWIEPARREQAQALGYTVVDATTVIATHLSHVLQMHAHELFGYEDARQLLDNLARTAPKLVEELTPKLLSLGVIHKVLQNLLAEWVPIRDIRTIAETLAEQAVKSQDPDTLTAAVRLALARTIVQSIGGMAPELAVTTLDPALEQILLKGLQGGEGVAIEPGLLERLQALLAESAQRQEAAGQTPVLLVSPGLRRWLARLARATVPNLRVLSYSEIPDNKRIRVVASIGGK
jgi:flagellar biosynthesis protein FlhA